MFKLKTTTLLSLALLTSGQVLATGIPSGTSEGDTSPLPATVARESTPASTITAIPFSHPENGGTVFGQVTGERKTSGAVRPRTADVSPFPSSYNESGGAGLWRSEIGNTTYYRNNDRRTTQTGVSARQPDVSPFPSSVREN